MNPDSLTIIVSLLVALSVASERLVELVKGVCPFLNREQPAGSRKEGWRRATLQALAVGAGVLTAWLVRDLIDTYEMFKDKSAWVALGLLASGGSGLWNAVLGYVTKLKEIKSARAEAEKVAVRQALAAK